MVKAFGLRTESSNAPRTFAVHRSCDRFGELQLRSGIAGQGYLDDLTDQLGVRAARLARGEGELRLYDEPGIGVGVNHVEFSVGSEAQVDAGVVAKLERAVCEIGRASCRERVEIAVG